MRGAAVLKDGSPYLIGKTPADFPHRIYCARCKRVTMLTRQDWLLLPEVKQEHIDAVQVDDTSHQDFRMMTKKVQES